MTLTLDKGLNTERILEIKSFFEHPVQGRLNAGNEIVVASASDIPDYSEFLNNPDFTTLEIKDGGVVIPTQAEYNHIDDFTANYFAESKIYSANIVLGKTE